MTGYINVMLVLQSCTDPLHIPLSSSSDTYGTSSDCAFHGGNIKVQEDLDMQVEEEEVNVKTEKGRGSEEEECIGVEDEEGICSEKEEVEKNIDIKEEEDVAIKGEDVLTKQESVDIKEEVSLQDTL